MSLVDRYRADLKNPKPVGRIIDFISHGVTITLMTSTQKGFRPKAKTRFCIVLLSLTLLPLFSFLMYPGPVFYVDLYWTAALETGFVDPTRDVYPWTVAVDWSPDGRTIAASGYYPDVLLFDASSGRLVGRLKEHKIWVQEVVFSPDGTSLASVDWDGRVVIWDVASQHVRHALKADPNLFTVSFHPTAPLIAVGSYEGTVAVFNPHSENAQRTFHSNDGGTLFVAYSPNGQMLASAGEDAVIRLFDADTDRLLVALKGHEDGVTALSFTSDGLRLLSCGDDGAVRFWDIPDRKILRTWKTGAHWVNFCTLLPGGDAFLSADSDGRILSGIVAESVKPEELIRHKDWAQCVRASRDGHFFASAGKDGFIHIYDLKKRSLLRTIDVSTVLTAP